MTKNYFMFWLLICCLLSACGSNNSTNSNANDMNTNDSSAKLKALIIDGENNHGVWPLTTMIMKDFLLDTDLFEVDIARTANTWQGPHYDHEALGYKPEEVSALLDLFPLDGHQNNPVKEPVPDPNFNPDFSQYDVVINNMGWKASPWSEELKTSFVNYMKNGGGLVVIHAANNSWGDWPEYNEMIGLGGWGGRTSATGSFVSLDDEGLEVRNVPEGGCGSHGAQMEYILTTRAPQHPIMKGLPEKWLHAKDELYDRLCGPGENMTVLATAYSDVEKNGPPWNKEVSGTGRHEPLLIALEYGKGRIFHSGLGHMGYSMECVGFMTTFQRGAEWAASGKVTQAIPDDFPTESTTSSRSWKGRKVLSLK